MNKKNDKKTPNHISSTQLNMFFSCGEAYRRRYIEDEKIPPGVALVHGYSGHKALQINNEQKIKSKKNLNLAEFQDAVVTALDNKFREGVLLQKEEEAIGLKKVKAQTKDSLISLAPLMIESAQLIQPVSVEERQEIKIPSIQKSIVYILDVEDDQGRIIDYKFGTKKKSQSQIDTDCGLTTYSLAYFARNNQMPADILFHNFVSGKKNNAFHILNTFRNMEDFAILLKRIDMATKSIDAGLFMPAEIGHWKCCPKWCGYFFNCPYVNSERMAAAENQE